MFLSTGSRSSCFSILSVSIAHCFPYGDVAEIGTRVLVIADGDKKKADALATRLGEELVSLRGKTQPPSFDVAAGVAARASPSTTCRW